MQNHFGWTDGKTALTYVEQDSKNITNMASKITGEDVVHEGSTDGDPLNVEESLQSPPTKTESITAEENSPAEGREETEHLEESATVEGNLPTAGGEEMADTGESTTAQNDVQQTPSEEEAKTEVCATVQDSQDSEDDVLDYKKIAKKVKKSQSKKAMKGRQKYFRKNITINFKL